MECSIWIITNGGVILKWMLQENVLKCRAIFTGIYKVLQTDDYLNQNNFKIKILIYLVLFSFILVQTVMQKKRETE